MTRRPKRPSLAEFVMARLDGPLRAAVASGGGDEAISRAISEVLQAPDVVLRARAASPKEREPLSKTNTCRTSSTGCRG